MFALSASQKPITPSLGSAVPLLPDSTETVFDSPLPPPPPSPSTSSHPNILLKIATPYDAEAFESFLIQFPELRSRYPNIVPKLKNGFSMGEFPELENTVIWPNSPTVEERLDFIDEYLREEVEAGRMDGPFSKMQVEEILGSPSQCSPISIDVSIKADGSEKLRLCTNLSKRSRQHPATNDFIDTSKYPTRFDTAAMVADTVSPSYSLSYFYLHASTSVSLSGLHASLFPCFPVVESRVLCCASLNSLISSCFPLISLASLFPFRSVQNSFVPPLLYPRCLPISPRSSHVLKVQRL